MTITISPEVERRLRERAHAEGVSNEAYVEQLIREDEELGEVPEAPIAHHDPDFGEVKAALTEGLEQAKRGESSPAEDVFSELRAKHGISR
jgi:predicted transcriptional regulator